MKFDPPPNRDAAGTGENDHDLVRKAGTGDSAAWSTLVSRHLSAIVNLAWYKTGDRAEAEDIAQETFIRLMKKAGTWGDDGAQLKTWLYRVALNLCIDRHRARKPLAMEDHMAEVEGKSSFPSIDDDIDRKIAVRRSLEELPERQQTAIVLVHYQGLSNREAAALLEISVDAVESLLSRARRALRQGLAAYQAERVGAPPGP